MWSFLLCGEGSFTRYPQARHDRFLRREQTLGRDVGPEACFIDVALVLKDRRPVQAIGFWYPRYRLAENGHITTEHQALGLADALSFLPTFEDRDAKVVSITPYVARQRYELEHTWKPTPEQLNAAAGAINKAADLELVTHDREQLLWIDYGFGPRR